MDSKNSTPKKRAQATTEDSEEAKRRKRDDEDATRGREVIRKVRRSYFEDPEQLGPIYDMWGVLLCMRTFAQKIETPSQARENALAVIQKEFIEAEENTDIARFLREMLTRAPARTPYRGTVPQEKRVIEVDLAAGGAWSRKNEDGWTGIPQGELVVVCKHTGTVLGACGAGFGIFSSATALNGEGVVKDQGACLMNFFRGCAAMLTMSKFFDAKHHAKPGSAGAQIEHARQTLKAQLASASEGHYDTAIGAAAASLDALRERRRGMPVPEAVQRAERDVAEATGRLSAHDARYQFLANAEEADEGICAELDRLRTACHRKKAQLMATRQKASEALERAISDAGEEMGRIAAVDEALREMEGKYHELRRKADFKPADFGALVDGMVERMEDEVAEAEYFNHFRRLLYLFDNPKTLPALVQQLKRIISHDAVRLEACMAFVLGVNEHFAAAHHGGRV